MAFKFTVTHRTNSDAPSQGKKTLDVFATDFESAIVATTSALESAGWTVLDKTQYEANVTAGINVTQMTYVVSYVLIG